MAEIIINEISQNYTYNIGTTTYATVAMPITAMWGPAYMDPTSLLGDDATVDDVLEQTEFKHFPATQTGLESFVSTYRGPESNYRRAEDYSYQMAVTLLTAGYDVLVCRVCPGAKAYGNLKTYEIGKEDHSITFTAKYPGSFGNNIQIALTKHHSGASTSAAKYWNLIIYVIDSSGTKSAVENHIFVFDRDKSTDSIPHISELESNFITISTTIALDTYIFDPKSDTAYCTLTKGSDTYQSKKSSASDKWTEACEIAKFRYTLAGYASVDACKYISAFTSASNSVDSIIADVQLHKEWVYTAAYHVYDLLQDKLNYNPQRIISPGWDDQDICSVTNSSDLVEITDISPLHKKIMETAYKSRCATGFIDIPVSEKRSDVYNETSENGGYAQKLARSSSIGGLDSSASLFSTHSALFGPWGTYKYVGTSKQYLASPSFLALMLQRSMILNQSLQYEWALPTNRKHTLRIGKMQYKVPKKILDNWQKLEGVGVNVITEIPELGLNVWGNSTLFEVPPATYQALANLSTRFLVNAVKDIVYKCGISITFQYNNEQAYNKFYAGVTPTLDTMKNVGAISDYYVVMSADINGLDQVNANTVIGKVYLVINGVVNDIKVDLIALPPGTDLTQYRS